MSNDLVCEGLTLTPPYTLEALQSFDAQSYLHTYRQQSVNNAITNLIGDNDEL